MPLSIRSLDDIRALPGIYHLRRSRYSRAFLRGTFGTHWGQYDTAQSARAAVPASVPSSYDTPVVVDVEADMFAHIQLSDWPALFHLHRLISAGMNSLTDFGGHLGAKYYAFRGHLPLSPSFAWQVVETPTMAREGARRAAASNATGLSFFERLEDSPPADILFCSGSLQYYDGTILDILDRLPRRPRALVLSKLPICEGPGFFTLDNLQQAKVPYRIFSDAEHDELCAKSGYERAERWHLSYRDFEVPFSRPRREVRMYGELWLDPSLGRLACTEARTAQG